MEILIAAVILLVLMTGLWYATNPQEIKVFTRNDWLWDNDKHCWVAHIGNTFYMAKADRMVYSRDGVNWKGRTINRSDYLPYPMDESTALNWVRVAVGKDLDPYWREHVRKEVTHA